MEIQKKIIIERVLRNNRFIFEIWLRKIFLYVLSNYFGFYFMNINYFFKVNIFFCTVKCRTMSHPLCPLMSADIEGHPVTSHTLGGS
jgi:hypothetical protein